MLKGGVLLGAEESGGIGFPNHIPERDGIAAGLMLLELLATEKISVNKMLAKMEKQFGPHRYSRIDTHFPLEKRATLMEFLKNNPPAKLLRSPLADMKTFDGVKYVAADSSWLMLRGSGTEPVLRIYAEAKIGHRCEKTSEAWLGVDAEQKVPLISWNRPASSSTFPWRGLLGGHGQLQCLKLRPHGNLGNFHQLQLRGLQSFDDQLRHAPHQFIRQSGMLLELRAQPGAIKKDRSRRLDRACAETPDVRRKQPRPAQRVAGAYGLDADGAVARLVGFQSDTAIFNQVKTVGDIALVKDKVIPAELGLHGTADQGFQVGFAQMLKKSMPRNNAAQRRRFRRA